MVKKNGGARQTGLVIPLVGPVTFGVGQQAGQ